MRQRFIVNPLDENLRDVVCLSCDHQAQYDRQELQKLLATTFLHSKCPHCGSANYDWTLNQQTGTTGFGFRENAKTFANVALRLVGIIYLYGLILGGATFVWNLLSGDALPALSLWQYAVAPFVIGLAMLTLEGIGELLMRFFSAFKPPTTGWKRLFGLLLMIAFGAALVLGPILYNIKNP